MPETAHVFLYNQVAELNFSEALRDSPFEIKTREWIKWVKDGKFSSVTKEEPQKSPTKESRNSVAG